MMKSPFFLSSVRRIQSSFKRFFSLFCLAFLGVGFYAGIKATVPDMLSTIDSFYDEKNVYDLEISSTLGFDEGDVSALKNLSGVLQAEGLQQAEVILPIENMQKVMRVFQVTSMNELTVLEGRLPSQEGEIAVEENVFLAHDFHIGDHLTLQTNRLKNQDYEIVGMITSPLYLTSSRGNTNLGSGVIDYIGYVHSSSFVSADYAKVYVLLNGTKSEMTDSDAYWNIVQNGKEEISNIQTQREDLRLQTLFSKQMEMMKRQTGKVDMSLFPTSKWYLADRSDSTSYQTYIDATNSISKLGTVFPLIFYIVAILISLISMMRMVEEDRVEIGTLKGLGFSSTHIASRYFLYAFFATILGGTLGMFLGFQTLPRIIWNIYCNLFTVPFFLCGLPISYGLVGLILAVVCICGSALFTSYLTLREKPSMLMRPKAPKPGKRILLEHIPLIWKHISFSRKIVIRNLLRYKKRVLAMITGIMGSTALILVGFGLKDSIVDIVHLHFDRIFVYDQMISLQGESEPVVSFLEEHEGIESVSAVYYDKINLMEQDQKYGVQLIVPMDDHFDQAVHLHDVLNLGEEIDIPVDGVLLSEKLAKKMNVQVGDFLSLEGKEESIVVGGIVENYIQDYIYMRPEVYSSIYQQPEANVLFVVHNDHYSSSFDEEILARNDVMGVINQRESMDLVNQILVSLNSVVLVLIISSAVLAFVILYNLSTINISERRREISTLKVLGFYDHEVDAYITRENSIITVMGILFGLVLGYYLCFFIIETCEPDFVMFVRYIKPVSFLYAVLISTVFTLIVNLITHFHLKQIDMVASLKSNE